MTNLKEALAEYGWGDEAPVGIYEERHYYLTQALREAVELCGELKGALASFRTCESWGDCHEQALKKAKAMGL